MLVLNVVLLLWCRRWGGGSPPIVSTTSAMLPSPSCADRSHERSSLPCPHWEALWAPDCVLCNEVRSGLKGNAPPRS